MDQQIGQWIDKGLITPEQAEKMRSDLKQQKKLTSQSRFITVVSIIGAVLLGLGAILFVGSNWDSMHPVSRILLLTTSTITSYYVGYYLRYGRRNYPKVGASLVFLSAILIGATIFLITQIYHVNAGNSSIILAWLVLIIPLILASRSESVTALGSLIFYFWFGYFMSEIVDKSTRSHDEIFMPSMFLNFSIALYGIGSIAKGLSPFYKKVGKTVKWISLQAGLIAMFILSFDFFSDYVSRLNARGITLVRASSDITLVFIIATVLAVGSLVIFELMSKEKDRTTSFEFLGLAACIFLGAAFFFFPVSGVIYAIAYNLLMVSLCLTIIFIGYTREEIGIVNLGLFWIAALIIARYFDLFWDMLDTSVFFLLGGALLTGGAVIMERARRNLKKKFQLNNLVYEEP